MYKKLKKIISYIYIVSRKFLAYHLGIPYYERLLLNLTSLCNSNCIYCEVKKLNQQNDLPYARIIKLIDEAKDIGVKTFFISGGEPFLHPNFWEIIQYVKAKGLKLTLVTNGLLLTRQSEDKIQILRKCVDKLFISLESSKPEIHDQLRGGQGFWELTTEGIKRLTKFKDFNIVVKPVISQNNIYDLPEYLKFCADLGVKEISFQPLNTETNFPNVSKVEKNYLSIKDSQLLEVEKIINQGIKISKDLGLITNLFAIKQFFNTFWLGKEKEGLWFEKLLPKYTCIEVFTNLFIASNGDLLPCALIPAVGNITNSTLKEEIKKLAILRKNIKNGKFPSHCKACSCVASTNLAYSAVLHPLRNKKQLFKLLKDYF